MRFAFVDIWKKIWPIEFLCHALQMTSRGFRAWKARPVSQRQRDDMVFLDPPEVNSHCPPSGNSEFRVQAFISPHF